MDKELLRVVIILIGMLVMVGILVWHYVFKSLRERRESDYFDDSAYDGIDEDEEEEPFSMRDDFVHESLVDGDALLEDDSLKADVSKQFKVEMLKPSTSRNDLPKLIEFSLVARADQGFNGEEMFDAFQHVGLEFGSVKVFERVDKNRMVHFAVASMIGSGTFPEHDLENFYCPGIVFYMQPREVAEPLAVFDDFVETIDVLAEELDGVVWDNQKQPLTAETIAQLRQSLAKK